MEMNKRAKKINKLRHKKRTKKLCKEKNGQGKISNELIKKTGKVRIEETSKERKK